MRTKFHAAAFVLVAFITFACGAGAQHKTLLVTLQTVNSARAGFIAYDQVEQDHIVKQASSYVEGSDQLTAYRLKRTVVVEAFAAAYYTIAIAATDMSNQHLADVIAAAAVVYQAYQDLKDQLAKKKSTPAAGP